MKRLYASYLLLLALLVGCQAVGLPQPQDFNEKLTTGYGTITGINDTTAKLLAAKKIQPDDAQHILDQTKNARAGLDIVRAMHNTDPTGADSKLTAIRSALSALGTYLTSKGG
jgi:hypothetical protein